MQELSEHVISSKKEDFFQYYAPTRNWQDDPEQNIQKMLISFYGKYYTDKKPNYDMIRQDITSHAARELFLNLFPIKFNTIKRINTPALRAIMSNYGADIMAHGVEESKGGMKNLLLMCISNHVNSPADNWGAFVDGMPNISPIPHGPYFLIYSMLSINAYQHPHRPQLSEVARILVPFEHNKTLLAEKLSEMSTVGLVTHERAEMFLGKLRSYDELLLELKSLEKNLTRTTFKYREHRQTVTDVSIFGKSKASFSDEHYKKNWMKSSC